ncbi:MAG: type II secretion system F family protein [Actinomycetota bacterium]|nr:type II secretion system F family protein [Actinomycetota bacterium]
MIAIVATGAVVLIAAALRPLAARRIVGPTPKPTPTPAPTPAGRRRGTSPHELIGAPRRRLGLRRSGAHRRVVERSYPDAIDLVVLAVRAGHLPAAALQAAVPHLPPQLAGPFAEVGARTASGERFADALSSLPTRLGPIAAPLADSFAAADRYGQPLAPVLERLADEARQRRRRQADALARQLPVRLSLPLVLCTLPSFVFLAVVPLLLAALSSLHR